MFGKILAGALIGVGAVAAAPFTGGGSILGAASLAASLSGAGAVAAGVGAVGAGVGAVAGAAVDEEEENERRRSEKRGEQKAEAKFALRQEKLEREIKEMMSDIAKREQFIVTAFAVGICSANCDGVISQEEIEELDYLVAGIGTSEMLSSSTKKQIEEMRQTPPNLNTVWALINEHGLTDKKYIDLFSEVINIVIEADEKIEVSENDFVKTWHKLAA